jgi:hypothetical protein
VFITSHLFEAYLKCHTKSFLLSLGETGTGDLITTYGLCGGIAYSSLDYYSNGIPIPTHRTGDFGDPELTYPPDGRLHAMIFNRLIDSFKDNFDKWSCVYPDLDAAVGAALGLVYGGGLIGGLVGAVDGWVYGELH